ncbi:uncharacterized protein [Parasteatoda tepidariorum]|uniref:uncharacterized protein n=1 Tax=Parasteatoda tepidariorum TaxID=114398 RepID=UPI00077FDB8E|nr:uncharacterized protein LOC107455024 [Parasteatoda tepidariorum]
MCFRIGLVLFFAVFAYVVLCDGDDGCDEVDPPLQTMKHKDLVKTISCINEAQNKTICKKFHHCEEKMPKVVKKEFKNCDKDYSGEGTKKCMKDGSKMFESKDHPEKIMKCMKEKSPEMDDEDKKDMKHFEECIKKLHQEHCNITKAAEL